MDALSREEEAPSPRTTPEKGDPPKMSMPNIHQEAPTDALSEATMDAFRRRITATPPGQCPVTLVASLLETSAAQTCGKCVPCRDGLPQLARLMQRIARCEADEADLERARALAEMIAETSDCAIGWDAGAMFLESLERFKAEFESHIHAKCCGERVRQTLPCETLCPAHVDVPGYIALAAAGDCAGSVALIRRDNPFPTACAFVCEHPCEKRCRRTLIDAPVNIRGIKRYAVDKAPADTVPVPKRLPDTGRHVAVVGAGPAGLTCAYYLALMGHSVEVFETRRQAGGMMRYGIPAYRFPRERLDEDVRAILSVGNITLRTESPVDEAKMRELARKNDAVFVAIGAHAGKTLRLPGIDAAGVSSAVDFLRDIGDGFTPDFRGRRVAVIGGGNVAMDCVRTAVRAGAEEVNLVYRRRIEDMTALREEIDAAVAEGVEMLTLRSPVEIEKDESGHCRGLVMRPQMISTYSRGRPAPVDAAKPVERIDADVILIAVGQDIVSKPFEDAGMAARRGAFLASDALLAPGFTNVFTGGDCQTGPATVIKAIAAGKVAARSIDETLGFHHTLPGEIAVPPPRGGCCAPTGRVMLAERPVKFRKRDFLCTELGMSDEEALQECGRCLRCDRFGCGSMTNGRIRNA